MTPEEVVEVVGLLAVAFGRDTRPETFEVYEFVLGDLDIPDPRRVVKSLLRTMDRWPSPSTLRREFLAWYGLLAPDEDQAWTLAVRAAQAGGIGELPGPVKDAVEAVGGSWGIRVGQETTIRAQFRDAYRLVKTRADRETVERSWKGLPLNPRSPVQLGYGRDHDLDHGGGRVSQEREG